MNSRLASSPKPGTHPAVPQRIEDAPMAQATSITSTPSFLSFNFDQFFGLVLVAGLPALFWTAIAFVACASFGIALSLTATSGIAVGIAAFLTVIFRVLSQGRD